MSMLHLNRCHNPQVVRSRLLLHLRSARCFTTVAIF
uniref:Predicted protein n=1 Tax=Hordeum vulgare subsp. vulgare TaxID=112509 RepID=F2DX12_HORVV|nr:predicted protein [Hordeum vulgare subsp. vulgare]